MSFNHIIFGAGAIARAAMNELLKRGERVRVVNRSGAMPEAPAGVEWVKGDLYDPAVVRELSRGARHAYQCAQPAYHEWPQKFPPLQAAIIEGLSGSGIKLVIVENLYMYGDTGGAPLTESLPYNAHTRKGQVRARMARDALAAHAAGKLRVAAARGADYFGPWGTGSSHGERLFYPVLAGKGAQMGGRLDLPHAVTYVPDLGKALVTLAERDDADGQAWHVPNAEAITQGEFVRRVCAAAGVPPRMSSISRPLMALAGLFIPGARESVEMMYEFDKPFIVDSSRFERAFSWRATPLSVAIAATLDWYRAHPPAAHEPSRLA